MTDCRRVTNKTSVFDIQVKAVEHSFFCRLSVDGCLKEEVVVYEYNLVSETCKKLIENILGV